MKKTHGMSRTPEYRRWIAMKNRCYNKKDKTDYVNYGGRGIRICIRWMSFKNFFKDMGSPPKGYTIERINNNGNYSPSNCKWIPKSLQGRNTRHCHFVKAFGEKRTIAEWARINGINRATIETRLKRWHWPNEKAVSIKKYQSWH